jgi:ureidoglycolate hydrolase
VAGTSVTFEWSPAAEATRYYLVVSANSNLNAPRKFEGFVTGTSQTVTGFPNIGTTYYWALWAINTAGWCSNTDVMANKRSFVNGVAPTPTPTPIIPAAPALSLPAPDANVAGTSITFEWSPAAEATRYYLVVSTNSNLNATRKFEGFVTGTSQTVTGLPNIGTTYYWTVWSINTAGWCSNTDVMANKRSFVNGVAPTPTPTPIIPAAPALSLPAPDANVAGASVTFTWSPAVEATRYYLVVSANSNLNAPRKFEGFVTGTSQTVTGFPNIGTTYYWTLWSINTAGWCSNTDVMANIRSFINGP